MEVGLRPYPHAGPDALAIYRELGYVVGDRLSAVVGRFVDQTTEGWLTDRGAVYVTLGPPDEVFRHLDQQESLTRDSRLSLLEAVERLYS